MTLKTFTAETMAEALRRVRDHFGDGGVIVSTRTVSRTRLPGIKAKTLVEITAARGMEDLPAELQRGSLRMSREEGSRVDGATTNVSDAALISPAVQPAAAYSDPRPARARPLSPHVFPEFSPDPEPKSLYASELALAKQRVASDLAKDLVDRVRRSLGTDGCQDPVAVRAMLREFVASMLPTCGELQPGSAGRAKRVALVGPTGVGKTTTIAKLAADLVIRRRLSVGLITLDTVRVGAVEQLRTYADVLGVPLEVAAEPADLALSARRLGDRSILLIDTPGCAARDAAGLTSLRECLARVTPDEVHLVLAGCCDEPVLHETLDRYRDLGVNRVIFTKLDEAIGFGVMLNCLRAAGAALSYVTAGPNVPDDIQPGAARALANLIVGEPVASEAGPRAFVRR
ncbi:MAG: flagellar biosynthesis protein FlhF [Phycisphaerales bacterium]|nr:flagellar biosynthesis protein FlhF [Phycisphaerales bacterium]